MARFAEPYLLSRRARAGYGSVRVCDRLAHARRGVHPGPARLGVSGSALCGFTHRLVPVVAPDPAPSQNRCSRDSRSRTAR